MLKKKLQKIIIEHAKQQWPLAEKIPLKQHLINEYPGSEITCTGLELDEEDLSELNLSDLSFCGTSFCKATLEGVILDNTALDKANFTGAKELSAVALSKAIWTTITVSNCILEAALIIKEKTAHIETFKKTNLELKQEIKENKAAHESLVEKFFKLALLMSEAKANSQSPAIASRVENLYIKNMVTNGGLQVASPMENQQQAEQISAIISTKAEAGTCSNQPLKGPSSMLENKISVSLLLKGLQDSNLNQEQRALLEHYQIKLLSLFQKMGSPSNMRVAEIVTLAITNDEKQYQQIISSYLTFLQKEPILEGYHMQGLADMVSLAQKTGWITPFHGQQILSVLLDKKRNSLLSPTNKNAAERYQSLSLWQHVLFVLTEAGTEIQEDQKKDLRASFKEYQDSFMTKEDSDEVGLSLVALAQQSLLHVKDDEAPLWQRAGLKTLSAVKNMTLSVAAIGAIPVTFGLSSLGAIAPGIDAIGDISALVKDIYRHIKDKKDAKEWYQQLLNLRSLLILSVYLQKETQFKTLIEDFINLPDKQLKLTLAHGLVDTITQILISWPDKKYQVYHQHCYELLKHWVNTLDNEALESRLFAAMAGLMNGRKVNMSFEGLWIDYLKSREERFNHLALTSEFIEGIKAFYLTVERIKEESQGKPAEVLGCVNIQILLVSRLVSGYTQGKNERCLEVLCALERDPQIKDKSPLENGMTMLYTYPNGRALIEEKQHHLRTESSRPSLMLTVWVSLRAQQKNDLAVIFQRYGVEVIVEEPSEKASYIFGNIGKLIVGVVVARTGTMINQVPKSEDEAKAIAILMDKVQSRTGGHQPSLAKEVGFAFFGHYVEGLMIGLNDVLVKEAVRLAERYLSEDEQKQSISLESNSSTNSGSNASNVINPILSSSSSSQFLPKKIAQESSKTGTKKNEQFQLKPQVDGAGNESYIVEIKYTGLSNEKAKELQVLLSGEYGENSASLLESGSKKNQKGYIIQLCFEEKEAAELLIGELGACHQKKSQLMPEEMRGK